MKTTTFFSTISMPTSKNQPLRQPTNPHLPTIQRQTIIETTSTRLREADCTLDLRPIPKLAKTTNSREYNQQLWWPLRQILESNLDSVLGSKFSIRILNKIERILPCPNKSQSPKTPFHSLTKLRNLLNLDQIITTNRSSPIATKTSLTNPPPTSFQLWSKRLTNRCPSLI